MRRRVSGLRVTAKEVGVGSGRRAVMVRQVPLMAMESPRWASARKGCGSVGGGVIVRVVVLDWVEGEGWSRADIAVDLELVFF